MNIEDEIIEVEFFESDVRYYDMKPVIGGKKHLGCDYIKVPYDLFSDFLHTISKLVVIQSRIHEIVEDRDE